MEEGLYHPVLASHEHGKLLAKLEYWPTMQIFTVELIAQADSSGREGGSHRISSILLDSKGILTCFIQKD